MAKFDRMCKRKVRYCTKLFAERVANNMSVKYNRAFRVYKCQFCQRYHITKNI